MIAENAPCSPSQQSSGFVTAVWLMVRLGPSVIVCKVPQLVPEGVKSSKLLLCKYPRACGKDCSGLLGGCLCGGAGGKDGLNSLSFTPLLPKMEEEAFDRFILLLQVQ